MITSALSLIFISCLPLSRSLSIYLSLSISLSLSLSHTHFLSQFSLSFSLSTLLFLRLSPSLYILKLILSILASLFSFFPILFFSTGYYLRSLSLSPLIRAGVSNMLKEILTPCCAYIASLKIRLLLSVSPFTYLSNRGQEGC